MKGLRDQLLENALEAFRKLQWRLHLRFPNLFPYVHENRVFRRDRDAKENRLSKVPLDDELRQASVWGVELYGPKEISVLYENLAKLGWAGCRFDMPETDVLEWLRRMRRYGHTGQRNLGVVYRQKDKGAGRDYFAPMPDACEYLLVSVNQITPSLTAIHVHFVLNEDSSKIYESILNTDRKTIYRRFKGGKGYSVPGVLNQKREIIEKARLERARMASSWFAHHLPGLFSGGPLVDELPTGELITMKNHDALKDPAEKKDEDTEWPNLLGINLWFDGWLHPKHEGFGLILEEQRNHKKYHSIVTLKTSSLSDDDFRFTNGRGLGAYNKIVYEDVGGIAIYLAASSYLREIGRRIRETREGIGQASKNRLSLINTLDRLEAFYRDSIGDPAIAEELSGLDERHFEWDCTKFISRNLSRSDTVELPSTLCSFTNRIADGVHAEGRSARQLFQEFASTLSTRESIRAQQKMERLTIAAIVIASISVLIAGSSLYFGV